MLVDGKDAFCTLILWFNLETYCYSYFRNFRIFTGKDFSIGCSAFRLDRGTGQEGELETYSSRGVPLLSWVERIINRALLAS